MPQTKTINTTFAKHVHHVEIATLLQVWFTDKTSSKCSMPCIVPQDPTKPILFFKPVGERIMQVPVPKWLDEKIRDSVKTKGIYSEVFGGRDAADFEVEVDESASRLDDIGVPSV